MIRYNMIWYDNIVQDMIGQSRLGPNGKRWDRGKFKFKFKENKIW